MYLCLVWEIEGGADVPLVCGIEGSSTCRGLYEMQPSGQCMQTGFKTLMQWSEKCQEGNERLALQAKNVENATSRDRRVYLFITLKELV